MSEWVELENTKAYRELLQTKFGKKLTHNLKIFIAKEKQKSYSDGLRYAVEQMKEIYFEQNILLAVQHEKISTGKAMELLREDFEKQLEALADKILKENL